MTAKEASATKSAQSNVTAISGERLPTPGDIEAAAARIAGQLVATPLIHSARLSDLTGSDLWLKLESMQVTGAYKERGALNKLLLLTSEQRKAGVIAASAGNHALGLAYHAGRLNIPATLVMPETTPEVKVGRTRDFGAEIVLSGDGFDEAKAAALQIAEQRGLSFVHPFDDPDIIAGQGTIAVEMLRDVPDFDTLLIPIGGGGLASGMALYARHLRPDIQIIGVQSESFPSMANALDGQSRPFGSHSLAEGIAVMEAGALTRKLIARSVDDIILVDERAIEKALSLLLSEQRLLAEGAGAAGLAAMLSSPHRFNGRKVGTILCGGNIDTRLLSMILTRDLARTGRLARLRVKLIDKPGELVRVASCVADHGGNVIDVGHHRTYSDLPAKMTYIDISIDTQGQRHLDSIVEGLRREGFEVSFATY